MIASARDFATRIIPCDLRRDDCARIQTSFHGDSDTTTPSRTSLSYSIELELRDTTSIDEGSVITGGASLQRAGRSERVAAERAGRPEAKNGV